MEKFFEENIPYLHDTRDNLITSGAWKILLTMKIRFIPSISCYIKRLMHWKSDNREIMIGADDTGKIIE